MKILKIKFKNLNSLAGEWDIDFTHPDYISNGIFAITGPTGAGKTTILDAICLALYGQTPRLGKITESGNEIMSRHTGECSSELEFETGKGKFRVFWSHHRSRKKAGGKLQTPKHEISELDSGKILESKLRNVVAKVEEITGMDFDRFTQSILLAQGGFAAFLSASGDDRSPILEEITGTQIYSRISMKVHEIKAGEKKKLETIQSNLNGIQILSLEDQKELKEKIDKSSDQLKSLEKEQDELQKTIQWRKNLDKLHEEKLKLNERNNRFSEEEKKYAPELEKLLKAEKAIPVSESHVKLIELRKSQENEKLKLADLQKNLPAKKEILANSLKSREKSESKLEKVRNHGEKEQHVIKSVRSLDQSIGEKRKSCAEQEKRVEEIIAREKQSENLLKKRKSDLRTLQESLKDIDDFIKCHPEDEKLVENISGIKEKLFLFQESEKSNKRKKNALKSTNDELVKSEKDLFSQKTALEKVLKCKDDAKLELENAQKNLSTILKDKTLADLRTEIEKLSEKKNILEKSRDLQNRVSELEQDLTRYSKSETDLNNLLKDLSKKEELSAAEIKHLENLFNQIEEKLKLLRKVKDLETERKLLIEGKACPLCGATHHPYATENVPATEPAEEERKEVLKNLKDSENKLSKIRTEIQIAGKDLERIDGDRKKCLDEIDTAQTSIKKYLSSIEISFDEKMSEDFLSRQLENGVLKIDETKKILSTAEKAEERRLKLEKSFRERSEELLKAENLFDKIESEKKKAVTEVKRIEKELKESSSSLNSIIKEITELLTAYNVDKASLERCDMILKQLSERVENFKQKEKQRDKIKPEISRISAEIEKTEQFLKENEEILKKEKIQLESSKEEINEIVRKRKELFAEKDPDTEEKRINSNLKSAEKQKEESVKKVMEFEKELSVLNKEIENLVKSTKTRKKEIEISENSFIEALKSSDFEDEPAFLMAKLPSSEFDELKNLQKKLQEEKSAVSALLEKNRSEIEEEENKKLTEKKMEELADHLEKISETWKDIQTETGALKQQWESFEKEKKRHESVLEEIQKQRKELLRWEKLHELIGSSDGKKFRNFAQGLTFEIMVSHANRQLRKMSDRYILVRDKNEPLELNVIDNYQAGEIRSTKNLSGGESFIVSLALALGLSGMASKNVRVDSLFLDEGFGTLDEEALETALETLGELQQEGKLIGVISHVSALKERISTQISVTRKTGGRSRITGPGCNVGKEGN